MEKTKMTKKDYFKAIKELALANGRQDIIDFANREIALLDKKSNTKRETPKQKANEELMLDIRDILLERNNKPMRVSEIAKLMPQLDKNGEEISQARVNAQLQKGVKSGEIVRTEEKRVAYFSLADNE